METHKEESGGPKSATEQAQQSARVQAAAMEAHRLGAVRSEALATISLLETFCDDANGSVKANKEMMVPLGPLAFMPGECCLLAPCCCTVPHETNNLTTA